VGGGDAGADSSAGGCCANAGGPNVNKSADCCKFFKY
jgi:hypothetical protein